jgi:hypothetical protein
MTGMRRVRPGLGRCPPEEQAFTAMPDGVARGGVRWDAFAAHLGRPVVVGGDS